MNNQNAERFLIAFNRIEKALKAWMIHKKDLGFTRSVKILSKSNAVINRYQEDLLEYAALRNAIVHNRLDMTYVIAEPHLSVVERIERIEKEITEPKRVYPMFARKVTIFHEDDKLSALLQVIKTKDISKFPIYSGKDLIGLLSEKGITQWMAKNAKDNQLPSILTCLREVLSCQKNNNYRFITKDTTIYEAQDIFKNQIGQGNRLDVLLITDDGKPSKNLKGIITPRDIIDIP
ncbi:MULTISPECIES: CBS domain-containing protein [unclassified Virgibacillus]|uniref:CBS domain-containing protein n=1 Tax=unclassified Virgibacillus TaxID=2620237 RepID=UPI0024DE94B6|nr:CBS domain-containing protein [Virgibacillus sp. LDC-1]